MIRAQNLSLSFNNVVVFKNLGFTINHGENVCFSGPSGKGKSSLLKMLQGYIIPDTGLIEINKMELNIENIKRIRSMIAYIPQNINLPVINGEELLKLVSSKESGENVYYFIKELGMNANMLVRPFAEMSGGQKQRVVIAVCLSLKREIILLDEPTSSLDDGAIDKLISVISNLSNSTVLSASHNHEWISYADKTIFI